MIKYSSKQDKEHTQLAAFLEKTRYLTYKIKDIKDGPNPPDFVCINNDYLDSIELTELFKKKGIRKHSEKELEASQGNILKKVKEIIDKQSFANPFEVKVDFRTIHNPNGKYNIKAIVPALSSLIINSVQSVEPDFDKIKPRDRSLNNLGISKVVIRNGVMFGKKWLKNTRFNKIRIHFVRRDPHDEILLVLRKKGVILKKYQQKYRNSYLLIITNRYEGSQAFRFSEEFKKNIYETKFDRIFIFDYFNFTHFELKKANYNPGH